MAASSSLKLLPGSYVYSVKPTSFDNQIAAICSDDSLRVADPSTLELSSSIKAHGGLTCLESNAGNDTSTVSLITAGRDGFVRAWDMRAASKKPILKLKDRE